MRRALGFENSLCSARAFILQSVARSTERFIIFPMMWDVCGPQPRFKGITQPCSIAGRFKGTLLAGWGSPACVAYSKQEKPGAELSFQ